MTMPGRANRLPRLFSVVLFTTVLALATTTAQAATGTITNLQQLVRALDAVPPVVKNIHLEVTVCAASQPEMGVVVVRDDTGTELLELGPRDQAILPGDEIRIEGQNCLVRQRDLGIKVSAAPVVDNDFTHATNTASGKIRLKAGRHPLELDWFNHFDDYFLQVSFQAPDTVATKIPGALLWHVGKDEPSGGTNFLPGLQVECFVGNWETVPDFELLAPVKTGVGTNFDLQFRTQDELVGLRFAGFFDAPVDGLYIFTTCSDDGSLLFIDNREAEVSKSGVADVPEATAGIIGETMTNLHERAWTAVEGRVNFVRQMGKGLEFELRSEQDTMWVKMADATGLDPVTLLNSYVRVVGVGRGVLTPHRRVVLGKLSTASARELKFLDSVSGTTALPSMLVTAKQVQTLRLEDAKRKLPVRLRGVVTSISSHYYDHWMSIQDETRGIFIDLGSVSNSIRANGELWEVIGHSGAGDFAPVVVANRIAKLGNGRMPEPARPAWTELINGSMDVQWVEFQGLVTDVRSNTLSLLLAGGQLDVRIEPYEFSLKSFEKSVVRIRGVLYAEWDTGTREVRVGSILMRNASINVDIPAPADPFARFLREAKEDLIAATMSSHEWSDAQAAAGRRGTGIGTYWYPVE